MKKKSAFFSWAPVIIINRNRKLELHDCGFMDQLSGAVPLLQISDKKYPMLAV